MSEGFGKPTLDEQREILSKQVSPETGKRLFTNFTGSSMNVYIDSKRFKNQKQADPKWTKTAVRQAGPHDRIHVAHPSVLVTGEQAARELLIAFTKAGAEAVVNCWPTRDGLPPEVVRLGNINTKATLAFLTEAADAPQKAKLRAMNAARVASGKLGGSTGRKPKYTDAQVRAIKALYESFQGTIKEFEIAAGKLVGQERVPWRTVQNWATAGKRPWAPMGSKPIKMPRSKSRKRR